MQCEVNCESVLTHTHYLNDFFICENKIFFLLRSYGVLLWEIATYGTVPLESCSVQEIVEMAQQKILNHSW